MRLRLLAAMAAVTLILVASAPAVALAAHTGGDHDSSRVPVQLVVLGAALLLVVVVGSSAYYARKKLGLDKPPSPEDGISHH